MSRQRRKTSAPILLRSVDAEELLRVIRAKCRDCSGGSKQMVKQCQTYDCKLYPYRCCGAFTQVDMFRIEENRRD